MMASLISHRIFKANRFHQSYGPLIRIPEELFDRLRAGKPVSELCRKFEPVPQFLKNVRFSGGKPLEDKSVKQAIEEGRSRLGVSGRLVIRPSGTEPLIRVMAEGDDSGLVESVVDDIVGAIAELRSAA